MEETGGITGVKRRRGEKKKTEMGPKGREREREREKAERKKVGPLSLLLFFFFPLTSPALRVGNSTTLSSSVLLSFH